LAGTRPGQEGVTKEEKAALIKGVSDLLKDVLNKPVESTFVVIEEVSTDDWGWGGETTTAVRARETARDDAGVVPLPPDAGRR